MVGSHGAPPHDAAWRALHRLCLPVSPCGLAALTRLTPGPVQSRVPTDHSKSLREDCSLRRLASVSDLKPFDKEQSCPSPVVTSLVAHSRRCPWLSRHASGASPDPSPAGSGNGSSGAPATGSSAPWSRSSPPGPSGSESSATRPPFGYVDTDGKPAGYDVVYAERIGKDLGTQVEYVPVEAASRVEFLQTAKVDIILANFTVTPERKEKVDFANPYMKVALGVVSPDSALVSEASQLSGKKIIVVKGTTAETWLTKNHPELELDKYEQYNDATSALADGRGDAWVTDNTEALAWALASNGFTAGITNLGDPDSIAGAVTKGNETLLAWLNEQLITLGKEQFFHTDFEQTLRPSTGDSASVDGTGGSREASSDTSSQPGEPGMNWGIVFRSLPTYAEAALLTVRVALFGIAGALLVGMCCAVRTALPPSRGPSSGRGLHRDLTQHPGCWFSSSSSTTDCQSSG